MTAYKWSQTAAANDTIDSTINWAEGMSPAAVNNSARAMMAAIAKMRDDVSGNLELGGIATAYTVTTNQVFSALTDGLSLKVRANVTSGAAPTFSPDSLTAKPLQKSDGAAIPLGMLIAGCVYHLTYNLAADAWIVSGGRFGDQQTPTGLTGMFIGGDTPPNGYVFVRGLTIGNAASSATERANADTEALFTLIWEGFADSECPVITGRGASAAADFAASKRITMPDTRGRVIAGVDDMGGGAAAGVLTGSVNGIKLGAQTVTLDSTMIPAHTHTGTTGTESATHTHGYDKTTGSAGAIGSGGVVTHAAGTTDTESATHTHSFTSNPTGGGLAHANVQPTVCLNVIVKL